MLKRYVNMFLDIRRGEALLTFLMFLYYYLVLVTYYLLKPARDSLFLVELGARQLPFVFILTAIIIAPITTFYSQASRSLRLSRLIYVTSAVLIGNLFVLRWLLSIEGAWVFYLFYVWVSIYGALTASQYWLFANAVYDPAQGKRLFALLNLGGILGAMTGGEVTSLIVSKFGVATEDLLFVCVGLVVALTVVVWLVWRLVLKDRRQGGAPKRRAARVEAKEKFTEMFAMIRRSRHLTYLVGIIALMMATASFVDYQFKTVSVQSFPEKQVLTSFLGVFYSRLSMISLLLQVVFVYRILRVFGVTGIVMFLPLGLLFGSVAMFVFPGLVAAIILRGADGAFKYSLDKTGRELLFLPVPLEVKKRTKVFIDMFVDRWFRGLAGALLLLCTVVLGLTVRQLSLVVIALLVAWLTLVVLIRKQYVNAFRDALARREIDPSQLTVNIRDAAAVKTLRESLRSGSEREIGYALGLLSAAEDKTLLEELTPLLRHTSGEIRRGALELISRLEPGQANVDVERLIRDDDPQVRLAALVFVEEHEGFDAGPDVIERTGAEEDPRVKASKFRVDAVRTHSLDAGELARFLEQYRAHAQIEEVRVEVAKAIGETSEFGSAADMQPVLQELLKDDSNRVVAEAILAIGKMRHRRYVPMLIDYLRERRWRKYARDALVEYGDGVVGTLSDILGDDRSDIVVRRYIPLVLSRIPTQKSVDALTSNFGAVDASIRYRLVKALNRLRKSYPDLKIKHDAIESAFMEEVRGYYEILQISSLHRGKGGTDADALLARALEERLVLNLEIVFRLIGLIYPAKDIYHAYLGIVSAQKDRQASAVEFLDNVVGKNVKMYLLPIIDRVSEAVTIRRGKELFGLEFKTRSDALLRLITGPDAWLKTCALFCVTDVDVDQVKRAVRDAVRDPDPLVVETAKLAQANIA